MLATEKMHIVHKNNFYVFLLFHVSLLKNTLPSKKMWSVKKKTGSMISWGSLERVQLAVTQAMTMTTARVPMGRYQLEENLVSDQFQVVWNLRDEILCKKLFLIFHSVTQRTWIFKLVCCVRALTHTHTHTHTWARFPEVQVRIPSRGMGTFFRSCHQPIFRLSLTHTHTLVVLAIRLALFFFHCDTQ